MGGGTDGTGFPRISFEIVYRKLDFVCAFLVVVAVGFLSCFFFFFVCIFLFFFLLFYFFFKSLIK